MSLHWTVRRLSVWPADRAASRVAPARPSRLVGHRARVAVGDRWSLVSGCGGFRWRRRGSRPGGGCGLAERIRAESSGTDGVLSGMDGEIEIHGEEKFKLKLVQLCHRQATNLGPAAANFNFFLSR